MIEGARTAPADPWKQFERLRPVTCSLFLCCEAPQVQVDQCIHWLVGAALRHGCGYQVKFVKHRIFFQATGSLRLWSVAQLSLVLSRGWAMGVLSITRLTNWGALSAGMPALIAAACNSPSN